jgi:hypothetical protein
MLKSAQFVTKSSAHFDTEENQLDTEAIVPKRAPEEIVPERALFDIKECSI